MDEIMTAALKSSSTLKEEGHDQKNHGNDDLGMQEMPTTDPDPESAM